MSSQMNFRDFSGLDGYWHQYRIIPLGLCQYLVVACMYFQKRRRFIHVNNMVGDVFQQFSVLGVDPVTGMRVVVRSISIGNNIRGRIDSQPPLARRNKSWRFGFGKGGADGIECDRS